MIALNIAKRLLDEGFSVLTANSKKAPNYKWADLREKPLTKEELEERVKNTTTSNIGIITGYNDLECVDVDLKVFSTAKEQREFWEEYLSFLKDNIFDFDDKFVIAKTQNAGYHILYKSKRVQGNSKIAKLKGHKECIIESRGIGGYVVAYEKFLGEKSYKDITYITDEDREILWSISKTYDFRDEVPEQPKKSKKLTSLTSDDVTPWDDFNSKNNVLDIISNDFSIVRNLNDKYIIKRHGAKSPHSGYIYKDNDIFYIFSTGTQYPAEKALTAFSCWAYRDFNGDFSEAAKEAYRQGYGTRVVKEPEITEKPEKMVIEKLEFPIDIFPTPIQFYLLKSHETLDAIIDYMGTSLLWLISVVIGNSMQVEVKAGWKEKATIWVANVGRAGLGKTPSIKRILFPLQKANGSEIKRYIKERKKYEEYMNLSKKDQELVEKVDEPVKKQFIANDITIEALIHLHEQSDNSVGVFKDELAGWFKDMNKYRDGSDLEFWLSSWSGESVSVNRITRLGSYIQHPFIPVLGGIQPNILNQFYTEENKDSGFMDRILLSYPEVSIPRYNENEMPYDAIEWYDNLMVNFYNDIKFNYVKKNSEGEIVPRTVKFTPEAKKEWIRIFNKITDNQNSDAENEYIKSMYPKQKSYIPRFALLIHIFDSYVNQTGFTDISKESMLKAEKLSDYFITMGKKIKVDSVESLDIKGILKNNNGSIFDKVKAVYKAIPDFNRTELSEYLNCSRQTIFNHIKKIDDKA